MTLYLPLLAKNIAEKTRGVNVLEEKDWLYGARHLAAATLDRGQIS
jgi:hypothetical protein